MKINRLVVVFAAMILGLSCRNDDDGDDRIVIPPQTLIETSVENDADIKTFLQTHFYNYEEFENPPAGFDFKIKFGLLSDDPEKLPLTNFVQEQVIRVASSAFGRDDGEEVDHTLYYLIAREGVGESPTIGDRVILQYEGSLLDGSLFDGSSSPLNQYLPGFLRGYANGVIRLKSGTGPVENGDGTVSYADYGVGAVIMPSGLGYFSSSPSAAIPAYAPLIFKIDVLSFEKDTDFDGDGIPSIQEDVDGDGDLNNDNTDTDTEPSTIFLPNHNDTDDDQDGILTIDEIKIDGEIKKDSNGLIIFPDTDGDGTPDHLDNDN